MAVCIRHINAFSPKSRLTRDVQEKKNGFRAQTVLGCSGHAVDSHVLVDVFNPVFDRAHVGVGEGVSISEIHAEAGSRSIALENTKGRLQVNFSANDTE